MTTRGPTSFASKWLIGVLLIFWLRAPFCQAPPHMPKSVYPHRILLPAKGRSGVTAWNGPPSANAGTCVPLIHQLTKRLRILKGPHRHLRLRSQFLARDPRPPALQCQ